MAPVRCTMKTRTHPKLLAAVVAALLALPAAGQAPAAPASPPVNLPPVAERPTGPRLPGKVIWFDLVTPDPDRARPFYEGVLGWTFQDRDGYPVARDGGVPVAGILRMPEPAPGAPARPARWMPLVSVPDVTRAAAAVRANGGRVVEGPGTLGARGRFVAIADPRGAQLVLVTAAGGDPVDAETPPPGWMWAELWSDDLKVSTAFYRAVVGYEAWKVGTGKQATWILAAGGRPRAREAAMPFPGVTSHWLPYVLVKDLPAALARVPALGGQVLRNPGGKGAQFAVVTDPGGAAMVLEQRPEAPAEVAQGAGETPAPIVTAPPPPADAGRDLYGLDEAERKAAEDAQQGVLAESVPGDVAVVAPGPGVNVWIAPPAWGGLWGPGWWGYPPAWGGGYWWGPGWGAWGPYPAWRGGYGYGYAPGIYRPGYRPPPGAVPGGPRPPGTGGGYRPPAPAPGRGGAAVPGSGSSGMRGGGKSSGGRGAAAAPSRSGGSRPAPSRSGSGRH